MNKNTIIAQVQAGNSVHPEFLVFVEKTGEQFKAVGEIHKAMGKAKLFALGTRAHFKGM